MSDPMTTMFGPRRCSLCGKDHYRGSSCPDVSRQDREPRVYVAKPSGRIISEAAEAAFQVWERVSRWVWKSERERQGAITAFSAGWIAGEDAGSDTTDRQPEPRDTDESLSAPASSEKTLGEVLMDGFNATFIGGGWAEPLAWEDFDEAQQARYEVAAQRVLAYAKAAPAPSAAWQPIESAPTDERVLLWWPTIQSPDHGARLHRPPTVGCLNAVRGRKPTHWMPLPSPPVGEQ